ncbi:hypothetical protein KC346_g23437, partial [Hortaea werneckii]
GLPSLAGNALGQQPSFLQNEEAPTHVVGSQGRRGILPSAPGRPNPPAQGSGAGTKSMIPQKDADGKYPCPHCNKTYLHAKHLKRHLLRHTGDRPYMCHLYGVTQLARIIWHTSDATPTVAIVSPSVNKMVQSVWRDWLMLQVNHIAAA